MQNKSSNLVALFFIPLVAILLAAFFTLVFLMGASLYKAIVRPVPPKQEEQLQSLPVEPPAPIVPLVPLEETDENPPLPPEVQEENTEETVPVTPVSTDVPKPDTCPAPAVPVKITKPKRTTSGTPFKQGLNKCLAEGIFPCAWEDSAVALVKAGWEKNAQGERIYGLHKDYVNKQFWVMSAEGPIQRGVYDRRTGALINETIATINGTVTQVTQGNTTWYFDAGVLTKIRTSPYNNCNFHDWFFIDAAGNQDVCQCAYDQANCCARSPYTKGMQRDYCEIFTRGDDFCK